jgi:hypothetical protein
MAVSWPVTIECDECGATAEACVKMSGYGDTDSSFPVGLFGSGGRHAPVLDLLIPMGSTWGYVRRLLSCSAPCAEALTAKEKARIDTLVEEGKRPISLASLVGGKDRA